MANQELHTDYPELMAIYLSGNATDAEVQQLEAWVVADPEHRRQFMAFKRAWMLSGMAAERESVDLEANWQQTSAQLFPDTREARVRSLPKRSRNLRWVGMAAAISLVGALAIWALLQLGKEQELYVSRTDTIQTVDLPDGSTVTLNRASTIRYVPEPAQDDTGLPARRALVLEGDAFFDVERDARRPFVIRSAGIEVEVLGTSFYVDGRDGQAEVQVIVESGSVAVRKVGSDISLTLTPGQKAVYAIASDSLYRQNNEDINFLSIKTGTISFDNSDINQIAFALSRHYGVTIDYNGMENTANCSLNGDYEDYTLEEILEYLRETWGIEAVRNGDRISLSGSMCN